MTSKAKPLVINFTYEKTLTGWENNQTFNSTPFFSPIPSTDLSFCFEYFHQICEGYELLSLLKLRMVRRPGSNISPSLVMDVSIRIDSSKLSYSYFHSSSVTSVNIQKMNMLLFEDAIKRFSRRSDYEERVKGTKLSIKADFEIWDVSLNSLPAVWKESQLLNDLELFAKEFSSIFEPSVFSDIEFVIGDKSLPAHKAVLAAHSPVFLKMLTNDFKESLTNKITITDSTFEKFSIFLKYLYTGDIEDQTWPNIRELYMLADKYDIASLKCKCRHIILPFLTIDRVSDILLLAYKYNDDDMKKIASQFALEHIRDVVCKENWKEAVEINPRIGYDIAVNFLPK